MPTVPLAIQSLSFGDVTANGKGGSKSCPLRGETAWSPGTLRVLWQPRGFGGEEVNRVAISFAHTPEVEAAVKELEAWVLDTVSADSQNSLGSR